MPRAAVLTAGCVLAMTTATACGPSETGTADRVRTEALPVERVGGDVPAAEREDLEAVFERAGVEGTFVLYDTERSRAMVVSPEQAQRRDVPASTFKLVNSLIALQTGAVADVDEVIPYGGGPQPVPAWERDMSMREALPVSNVPVYQELARRIGHDRMAAWVDRFGYGDRDVGGADAVDRFWLEGPLEISAMDQVAFLADLARAELPVDVEHQRAVREIAVHERTDDYVLVAKTGWGADTDPAPGWWVGWVERGTELHTFALRIDVAEDVDAELREPLGRELLVALEVLPAEALTA
ncbi:class D beta-lactamase [Nocardiopsis sp. LOL_012]|uniref:class D beta-lactamase n=1 Tax=Nocardiopsis sp. LOL_012 TaxID=3345409 RepID=UPI003A86944F